MGRRPRLTDADHAAWTGFTQRIVPLSGRAKPSGRAEATPPDTVAPPAVASDATPVPRRAEAKARQHAPASPLAIGDPPAGVDKATWQRFRTGKLAAARKLDLHGMTAQRAFQALASFLRAAHADQARCVEIVTGRGGSGESQGGEGQRGETTGVLRRELPIWLNRPDIRPLVLAAAHPNAANVGAVRLLLRRAR
jgi:DNA-nicking Smr family endonuclease